MATKVSATQQLFAQWGKQYFAAHVGAKSVTPAVLQAWVDEEENARMDYESEQQSERAYEQMLERKSEPWASDAELMAMDPGDDDLPWDPSLTVK